MGFKKSIALLLVFVLLLGTLGGCSAGPKKVKFETPEQQAIVETALSYLARGSRIQYADTRLTQGDFVPSEVRYRWQRGKNSPEDATQQQYIYTNCAAFTYDVYFEALGYDILSYTTASLIQSPTDIMPYKYFPSGKETEEKMAEVEKEFRSLLKPGDIIVVRYNGKSKGNGHAMLYVGPDVLKTVMAEKNNQQEGSATTASTTAAAENEYVYDIIHSGGSNYNYSAYTEKFEKKGSISMTSVDMLFNPESSRYVFSKLLSFGIVRPLNRYEGGVPEKTQNRINNLYGVVAEKLCSHTVSNTVNPNEEITFTFSVENTTKYPVKLEIKDIVPEYTEYVSGAEAVSGSDLSWNLTVAAGEVKTASYTVRVKADAPYGTVIRSEDGTVGGVDADCKPITVAKTLTKEQQAAVKTAITELGDSELRATALANAIYEKVVGRGDLLDATYEETLAAVFVNYLDLPTHFSPALDGKYTSMLVPTLYGGRYTLPDLEADEVEVRTRLPYERNLTVGDILIAADDADATYRILCLYTGDGMYNLLEGEYTEEAVDKVLEKCIAYNRYAVLRPSMAL